LVATASLKYEWSHEQWRSHTIYTVDEHERWRDEQFDRYTWSTSVGLRISVEVLEQLSLEAGFGVVYEDQHLVTNSTTRYLDNGDIEVDTSSSLSDMAVFNTYGWNGLGSLGVMVWF